MKTALVTGGTRGIGLGIANSLARDGYALVLGYNSNHDAAKESEAKLREAYGVEVATVAGDTAKPETMAKLFDVVRERFDNKLTAFVHNAGLYVGVTTPSTEGQPNPMDPDFEKVWEYYQLVYPRAFKRGLNAALACEGLRHVVAISSPGCNATQPPQVSYEAPGQGKSAMEFLVRLHARALAPKGITVNCVIPGYTQTGAWQGVLANTPMTEEMLEGMMQASTPMQRWLQTSEIGNAVAFLCSDQAKAVTGVALPVDGGLHLVG
ncbi:SDR family NAD(P)-dependent oxidoreductase [Plesiocystis pacifica]|uniref:SDR family NAD(P)-dependent oxidoreductase n=1 Tax=Plesiocystis pacifica TaxID=191768 RepID=UPI0005D479D1|nr:SDR family oxidoreductase [Plesiocystis pacifica]